MGLKRFWQGGFRVGVGDWDGRAGEGFLEKGEGAGASGAVARFTGSQKRAGCWTSPLVSGERIGLEPHPGWPRSFLSFGGQRPGMIKVRPATMVSLLSPFSSLMASTVVLNFREIPQRESPV